MDVQVAATAGQVRPAPARDRGVGSPLTDGIHQDGVHSAAIRLHVVLEQEIDLHPHRRRRRAAKLAARFEHERASTVHGGCQRSTDARWSATGDDDVVHLVLPRAVPVQIF